MTVKKKCIIVWNALWYVKYIVAWYALWFDMHYDMDDEDVDMSTPGGDCADRPPGAYVNG